eukprot:589927-Pleurochrysis_carterae.AAC.1
MGKKGKREGKSANEKKASTRGEGRVRHAKKVAVIRSHNLRETRRKEQQGGSGGMGITALKTIERKSESVA